MAVGVTTVSLPFILDRAALGLDSQGRSETLGVHDSVSQRDRGERLVPPERRLLRDRADQGADGTYLIGKTVSLSSYSR